MMRQMHGRDIGVGVNIVRGSSESAPAWTALLAVPFLIALPFILLWFAIMPVKSSAQQSGD